MKAIKYYRPIFGHYTARLAHRIKSFCDAHKIQLFSFEENACVPLNGFFSYLNHLECRFSPEEAPDYKNIYAEKSIVILFLKEENNDRLQEIFEILKEIEKQYIERGITRKIPNFGHPELIEIQIDN